MNKKLALASSVSAFALMACLTAGQKQDVKDASDTLLSAQNLACIFASSLTDAPAVAKVCNIAGKTEKLIPLIVDLIGQREGAKRAGVTWRTTADAGLDAATDASQDH